MFACVEQRALISGVGLARRCPICWPAVGTKRIYRVHCHTAFRFAEKCPKRSNLTDGHRVVYWSTTVRSTGPPRSRLPVYHGPIYRSTRVPSTSLPRSPLPVYHCPIYWSTTVPSTGPPRSHLPVYHGPIYGSTTAPGLPCAKFVSYTLQEQCCLPFYCFKVQTIIDN